MTAGVDGSGCFCSFHYIPLFSFCFKFRSGVFLLKCFGTPVSGSPQRHKSLRAWLQVTPVRPDMLRVTSRTDDVKASKKGLLFIQRTVPHFYKTLLLLLLCTDHYKTFWGFLNLWFFLISCHKNINLPQDFYFVVILSEALFPQTLKSHHSC